MLNAVEQTISAGKVTLSPKRNRIWERSTTSRIEVVYASDLKELEEVVRLPVFHGENLRWKSPLVASR